MYFIFKYSSMKKLWIILFASALLIVSGCSSKVSTSDGPTVVKIGAIVPLSWPISTLGEDQATIYQDAVDEFNALHSDYQIDLVMEDGKCNAKDAVSAYQKLTTVDWVSIILGWACSSETIAAGQIADAQDVVLVSAVSSSPDISVLKNVFRFWNDLDSSKTMVKYFNDNNINSIAIVYENTDYAAAYANALKDQFKGTVISEQKYSSEEKDFGIIAKNIQNNIENIDMLVTIPQSDTTFVSLMRSFASVGVDEALENKIIGADAVYSESVVWQLGDSLEGVLSVQFPDLSKTNQSSANLLEKLNTEKNYTVQRPSFFPFTKEAVDVVLSAILDGNTNAAGIKSYLGNITAKNKRSGYIGDYYFDENGDGQWLEFVVNQVVDGKLVPLE